MSKVCDLVLAFLLPGWLVLLLAAVRHHGFLGDVLDQLRWVKISICVNVNDVDILLPRSFALYLEELKV